MNLKRDTAAAKIPRIKVCGIVTTGVAELCIELGVEAIGLNFWPQSIRYCDPEMARDICALARGKTRVVGVFVDASVSEVTALRAQAGFEWAQLHFTGEEKEFEQRATRDLLALLPNSYRAFQVGSAADLEPAKNCQGSEILLDSRVSGGPGGSGVTFDWPLAGELAKQRAVWLAGGLHAGNVREAIATVRPYGVDVASGVETEKGVKSEERIRAFVSAIRSV